MKKFLLVAFACITLCLTGCLELVEDITLNKDGSGTLVTTNDLGGLLGLAGMSGQSEELEKLKEHKLDTIVNLAKAADSLKNLTPGERALMRKGNIHLEMNVAEEKMKTTTNIPFATKDELAVVSTLSGHMVGQIMDQMLSSMSGQADAKNEEMPNMSLQQFYDVKYGKGSITRTLNADKYATIDGDEGMQAMKQLSAMGMPVNYTVVYHFPAAVKSATGKLVQLSDDKKTVTVKGDASTFFDDGKALEFDIKY